MPALLEVNKVQQVVTRLFTHGTMPTVVEISGAYHYLGQGPVEQRIELEWLPEPHRAKALAWFDAGHVSAPPIVVELEEVAVEDLPTKKTYLCGICGAGPFVHHLPYHAHLRQAHPESKKER